MCQLLNLKKFAWIKEILHPQQNFYRTQNGHDRLSLQTNKWEFCKKKKVLVIFVTSTLKDYFLLISLYLILRGYKFDLVTYLVKYTGPCICMLTARCQRECMWPAVLKRHWILWRHPLWETRWRDFLSLEGVPSTRY